MHWCYFLFLSLVYSGSNKYDTPSTINCSKFYQIMNNQTLSINNKLIALLRETTYQCDWQRSILFNFAASVKKSLLQAQTKCPNVSLSKSEHLQIFLMIFAIVFHEFCDGVSGRHLNVFF